MPDGVINKPPLVFPLTVLIDQREGLPYRFEGLNADADFGYRPLLVPTRTTHLRTGDYSLEGLENTIAIERKSLHDCYSTLGQQRERFVRELRRLQEGYAWAAVVVEAGWDEIIRRPPERSSLKSKTVFRSVLAWMQRFPRVHWVMAPDRRFAEVAVFRMLERFAKDRRPNGKLYDSKGTVAKKGR